MFLFGDLIFVWKNIICFTCFCPRMFDWSSTSQLGDSSPCLVGGVHLEINTEEKANSRNTEFTWHNNISWAHNTFFGGSQPSKIIRLWLHMLACDFTPTKKKHTPTHLLRWLKVTQSSCKKKTVDNKEKGYQKSAAVSSVLPRFLESVLHKHRLKLEG